MDPIELEELAEAVDIKRQEMINGAWAALLETEQGRLILWSIIDRCGGNQFPHFNDGRDQVFLGRQQVGSEVLRDHVFPLGMRYYTDMLLEAETLQQNLEVEILASIKPTED